MDYCPLLPMQIEMISPGSDLLSVATPIATLMVAAVGAWIAWNQVRASRNALKITLYDRRYAIFECASRTLIQMGAHGGATPEVQREFLRGTIGARWLFDANVEKLLDKEILPLMTQLDNAHAMIETSQDRPTRNNWRATAMSLQERVLPLHRRLNELCSPFLTLSH